MKDVPKKPKRKSIHRNIITLTRTNTIVSIIIEIKCPMSSWYVCITSYSMPVAARIHSSHP